MGVGGKNWLLHLIDGYIAGAHIDFLLRKSADESLNTFKVYQAQFETQTGKKLKLLRVDNSGEWINEKMRAYLCEQGIILETTTPYLSA
jgi:hypothetical protein